jgi:putative SOS response-associated peptidase YedK
MCGRFTRRRVGSPLAYGDRLAAGELPLATSRPRWNIAPGEAIVVLRRPTDGVDLCFGEARWGLIPSWAKDRAIGTRLINARAETIDRLPSFRTAFRRQRCVIIADGYYEWQTLPGRRRQPYFVTLADERPFGFAGLWDSWRDPADSVAAGPRIDSCTIITTRANPLLSPVHHRMPVILEVDRFDAWLDTRRPAIEALMMLTPYAGRMSVWPVSSRVNRIRSDDPDCLQPVGPVVTGHGSDTDGFPVAADLLAPQVSG